MDIRPGAGRLILPGTPRVERDEERVSLTDPAAAADARRGGAATLLALALKMSDALVLGRLAVPVDEDESELAPALVRGAINEVVLVAAPGARPATAVDLPESSAMSELRR